jgi:aryl-alcohol dehydrogenase-like predicted oxidoreductase
MFRFSLWEGSPHCNRRHSTQPQHHNAQQLALAWLLHRSPSILLIPGTSSRKHLRENLKAASLPIAAELLADLDSIVRP